MSIGKDCEIIISGEDIYNLTEDIDRFEDDFLCSGVSTRYMSCMPNTVLTIQTRKILINGNLHMYGNKIYRNARKILQNAIIEIRTSMQLCTNNSTYESQELYGYVTIYGGTEQVYGFLRQYTYDLQGYWGVYVDFIDGDKNLGIKHIIIKQAGTKEIDLCPITV